MERRPTIIDVAKAAGVSKSTVSLVLQRSPQVKEDTRIQVREAMARVGYVYNRSAANLRSASTGLIGLVINDLRNPFFTEFAASLQMKLAEEGYAVVLANINEDAEMQAKMIVALIEHGVSGFVVSPAYGAEDNTLEAIARAGLPAIQVFRKVDDRDDLFPFLAPDYQTGSRLATEHLYNRGCTQVAFVGGLADRAVTMERMSGYLEVTSQRGHEPIVITGAASHEFGVRGARDLYDNYPDVDGVLCFNDLVALGLMAGSQKLGRSIGKDLRVVGFDNIEGCLQSEPQLTSVSCGIPGFAEEISRRMLAWLNDGTPPELGGRTAVELVVRGSS
ncbi:LacI family DNA-binding transcriptional regulator [Roseobacter sp. YSTF-M11]|uniref:LacI family DNA-binding transcriptional regulator n=1 Tax=Roseobacter insulae TaxID=2859783 RepID=A0A9X1FSI2_9RHOB|nr:LacI family DNA-binding transcriptional regulator [Roseobacter insulae]MBW4706910.1 LacI family DNA-binding transcriptional regulator [Roseobacter insulae]